MTTTRTRSDRVRGGVSHLFLVLLLLGFLGPVIWALLSSFKQPADIIRYPLLFDPSTFTVDNFVRVFHDVPLGTGFLNTAIVLIIPLLLQMKAFGWINTYQALILPGAIDAFAIFWMRQVISAVPDELVDAARVDGCSEFGIFTRIVLPVIRPGLAGLAVLTIMNIYNDFVWPVIVANSEQMATIQVVLSGLASTISGNRVGADYATVTAELLAASSVALIPLLILFMALQRHFINGILAGSVKG